MMLFPFIASISFFLLYILSSEESDLFHDDSEAYGSDSGSSITCSSHNFSLRSENSVGFVSGLGSGIFGPAGVGSKCDIFGCDLFVPIGVESKGG